MTNFYQIIFGSALICLLCLPNQALCQDETWGVGTLKNFYDRYSLTVYDSPNGAIKGVLGAEGGAYELSYREEGPRLIISNDAFVQINIDEFRLKVFKEQEGFIQIFSNASNNQTWLSLVEIAKTQYYYEPWISFLANKDHEFIVEGNGMNVRSEPRKTGVKLVTAKGSEFMIKPTGVINGLWAEVIIMHYDSEYCEDRQLIKETSGHLKIVDDKGYPNIWFPGWCS